MKRISYIISRRLTFIILYFIIAKILILRENNLIHYILIIAMSLLVFFCDIMDVIPNNFINKRKTPSIYFIAIYYLAIIYVIYTFYTDIK